MKILQGGKEGLFFNGTGVNATGHNNPKCFNIVKTKTYIKRNRQI